MPLVIQASLSVRGLTSRTPPLVRDGVGEQADAAFVADARAVNGGHLRRPDGRQSVVGKLDDVEAAGFRLAEGVGEEVEFLGGGLGKLVCRRLVADGEVDLHIAGARRNGRHKAAGNHGARESRAWSS